MGKKAEKVLALVIAVICVFTVITGCGTTGGTKAGEKLKAALQAEGAEKLQL